MKNARNIDNITPMIRTNAAAIPAAKPAPIAPNMLFWAGVVIEGGLRMILAVKNKVSTDAIAANRAVVFSSFLMFRPIPFLKSFAMRRVSRPEIE